MSYAFRIIAIFLLLGIFSPESASADQVETAYSKVRKSYRELIDSNRKQLYRHNWEKIIKRFSGLAKKHSAHTRASSALFMAGKTSEGLYRASGMKEDALKAVGYYSSVAKSYSSSTLADDALFRAGFLEETVFKDFSKAYSFYKDIVTDHPKGDMASRAKTKLIGLARYAPKTLPKKLPKISTSSRNIDSVRYKSHSGRTRVVIDLSKAGPYKSNELFSGSSGQNRVYIDIDKSAPSQKLKSLFEVGDGILERVRIGQPTKSSTRIVFDLSGAFPYKVFSLENPARIVVDIGSSKGADLTADVPELRAIAVGGDKIDELLSKVPDESQPKINIPNAKPGRGLRRIVVDAGHGGKDPGAIGSGKVYEKHITLAIAKALGKKLRSELGCEVILTRDKDVFIPLRKRTELANKVEADLFISIHANAARNAKAYGIETYYLNFSKNDKAVEVAARENGTTIQEVGDLELILFDLMANSKINESSRLATLIQNDIVNKLDRNYSRIKDLGVREGPFHVLLGATMPSVLIEIGFISNKLEERRLKNRKYQNRIVAGISSGILKYVKELKLIASK